MTRVRTSTHFGRLVLALALAGLGCTLLLRKADWKAALVALQTATWWPVLLSMVINLVVRAATRTRRTQLLLNRLPHGTIGFHDLFVLLLGGYAAGALLPGPAEELVYTTALARRHGFRWRDLVSMHLLDKSLGVTSILIVALPVLTPVPAWCGGGLLALLVLLALALPSHRHLIEALAWLVVANLASALMLALCLRAVGAPIDPIGCLRVFALSCCACVLPSAMAQLGVLETALVGAYGTASVSPSTALVVALLYHFAQVAPLLIAGLPALVRLGSRREWTACPA